MAVEPILDCDIKYHACSLLAHCQSIRNILNSFPVVQPKTPKNQPPLTSSSLFLSLPLSFYNFKTMESAVAPNVALTPLPPAKAGPLSPSVPSTFHPSAREAQGEGAISRPRKRMATVELPHPHPGPEPLCPPSAAASKPPQEDSEVEIEVESREECEYPRNMSCLRLSLSTAKNLFL